MREHECAPQDETGTPSSAPASTNELWGAVPLDAWIAGRPVVGSFEIVPSGAQSCRCRCEERIRFHVASPRSQICFRRRAPSSCSPQWVAGWSHLVPVPGRLATTSPVIVTTTMASRDTIDTCFARNSNASRWRPTLSMHRGDPLSRQGYANADENDRADELPSSREV